MNQHQQEIEELKEEIARLKEIVEPKMEKVILDAAKEQGIKLELVPSAKTGMLELEAA